MVGSAPVGKYGLYSDFHSGKTNTGAEGVVFAVLCETGSVLASSASITISARVDAKLTIIS